MTANDPLPAWGEATMSMAASQLQGLEQRLRRVEDILRALPQPPAADVLILVDDAGPQSVRALEQLLVVGRSATADWPVNDALLSRRHFEVSASSGGFRLRDLGAKNGTRVNGQPVAERWLASGDLIQAGSQTFLFLARLEDAVALKE